jgi:hypothetical protein
MPELDDLSVVSTPDSLETPPPTPPKLNWLVPLLSIALILALVSSAFLFFKLQKYQTADQPTTPATTITEEPTSDTKNELTPGVTLSKVCTDTRLGVTLHLPSDWQCNANTEPETMSAKSELLTIHISTFGRGLACDPVAMENICLIDGKQGTMRGGVCYSDDPFACKSTNFFASPILSLSSYTLNGQLKEISGTLKAKNSQPSVSVTWPNMEQRSLAAGEQQQLLGILKSINANDPEGPVSTVYRSEKMGYSFEHGPEFFIEYLDDANPKYASERVMVAAYDQTQPAPRKFTVSAGRPSSGLPEFPFDQPPTGEITVGTMKGIYTETSYADGAGPGPTDLTGVYVIDTATNTMYEFVFEGVKNLQDPYIQKVLNSFKTS